MMKKQIIRKLCLNNDIIDLIEPIYINVKGNNVQVLARVIRELNDKLKELKEQLNAD